MAETTEEQLTPADDRIEGAKAIAAFMGITERQARWRIDRGLLPHAREGERVVASKAALLAHWREMTRGLSPRPPAVRRPQQQPPHHDG